jgi:hypothetical protein
MRKYRQGECTFKLYLISEEGFGILAIMMLQAVI